MQKLWNWTESKLTKEKINNTILFVTDNVGRTAWHWVAYVGNLDVFQKLLNWVEEKLTTEDINSKLLLATNNEGRTLWHVAAEEGTLAIFLKLWVWTIEELSKRKKIKLLISTDGNAMSVLYLAAI